MSSGTRKRAQREAVDEEVDAEVVGEVEIEARDSDSSRSLCAGSAEPSVGAGVAADDPERSEDQSYAGDRAFCDRECGLPSL